MRHLTKELVQWVEFTTYRNKNHSSRYRSNCSHRWNGRAVHTWLLRNAWLLEWPSQNKEAIDTAGWMHSGDLATMDEEGYINIVGRIKRSYVAEKIFIRKLLKNFYTPIRKLKKSPFWNSRWKVRRTSLCLDSNAWQIRTDRFRNKRILWGKIAHYTIPGQVNLSMNFQWL
jgi:hypothetical protein